METALAPREKPAIEKVVVQRLCTCPSCGHRFREGFESVDGLPIPFPHDKPDRGITITTRVKQLMNERSKDKDGKWRYRFDHVAEMFAKKLEEGDFNFVREFMNRLEGRVPQRLANADGTNIKMYDNMPTEGEQAP